MKALEETTEVDPQEKADREAVSRQLIEGVPVSDEVRRRVRERSERATAETRRLHGEIDVDQLLRDARDES
jgi:hypothetical protein